MSDNADLFEAGTVKGGGVGAPEQGGSQPERTGAPRVVTADRGQLAWRTCDLESLLPAEHRARLIWSAVEKLELSKFYEPIAARENEPGRPAIDPKILVALWLYATSEGVGSAREVARLCGAHDAYRWICGGVSVNHHTLSDFRVGHGAALDDLMTQVLAVLMHGGLVTLERVAQDGMRVRASAGAASFRREPTLKACLEAARTQVEEAKRQADEPDTQRTARERAAAERAAREREDRVTHALAELPKARAAKSGTKEKEQARVSTTDPEARVMKMGDGGYRPAYNAQFATDTASRVIVGVGVTNSGSDMGQTDPMRAEIERRTGGQPKELLIDGGFVKKESIEDASSAGTTVYAPVPKPRVDGIDPHQPKPGDSAAVAEWRQRMATPEAKDIYKQRAATAETVNADLRTWRGLDRFLVRGSGKVLNVILWSAITYNVMRWIGAGASG
jgi:transposase